MFIFGNRLFGKVDRVPGLGFVATRFFHIDYVPLIPNQGWLVYQQTGKSWRGIRVPLSAKSVLLAWLRTASIIGGVSGIVGLIVSLNAGRPDPAAIAGLVILIAACGGFFAFSKLHKSVTRASYTRACQLAKLAKLNDRGMAALATAYGQPPISYGFAPTQITATAADETIPVEELDADPVDPVEPEVIPSIPAPSTPRQESRRHG